MHVDVDTSATLSPAASPVSRGGRWGLLAWLASGVLLLAGLGISPVSRTQEARVLETSREMLGEGAEQWLIPKVNGRVRLQKPPLAYWLTAASFQAFGVGEGAGRVPAALAGWLTVGLTALVARWLFGNRAAFFAGAALTGSFLFFRHSRLAETDVLAMLFVTAAVYALWRGAWVGVDPRAAAAPPIVPPCPDDAPLMAGAGWFHLGAAAMALATLGKGPPAAYPLLFLVVSALVDRRPRALVRFVASGALVTFVVLAIPWFAYVALNPLISQLVNDLQNSAGGGKGHSGSFVSYAPQLLQATAPWTGIVLVALVAAVRRWKQDPRLRGLLVWSGAILVPLCLWGNKQLHYLMPLMPPLMILAGWLLDEVLPRRSSSAPAAGGRPDALAALTRNVLLVTVIACALAAPGVVVAAKLVRGHLLQRDMAPAAAALVLTAAVTVAWRRWGADAGARTFAAAIAAAFAVLSAWAPTLTPDSPRSAAAVLRARYGDGPYVFHGGESLPLVFHLRSIIPVTRTPEELAAHGAGAAPVVIQRLDERNPPAPGVVEDLRVDGGRVIFRAGRVARGSE